MNTKIIATALIHENKDNASAKAAALVQDQLLPEVNSSNKKSSAIFGGNSYSLETEAENHIYAVSSAFSGTSIARAASLAALRSLHRDFNKYIKKADRRNFEYADLADYFSGNADHAVRQKLTAWQGTELGATLAWFLIENDVAYTYSIGGNHIYLFRDSKLYNITDNQKQIAQRQTMRDYLGHKPVDKRVIPANLNRLPLRQSDLIIIATSAFNHIVTDEELIGLLQASGPILGFPDQFIKAIEIADSKESLSVIMLKVGDDNLDENLPKGKGSDVSENEIADASDNIA